MPKVTQETANAALAVCDGTNHHWDHARYIRDVLNKHYVLELSDNDARIYWEWRSNEFDAGWLELATDGRSDANIIEWFQRYVDNALSPA